jgi:hypothetical protein
LQDHLAVCVCAFPLTPEQGRAVAQAVSRWLPTAVARDRIHAASGVRGGQCGIRAGSLRVLQFPLSIIPPFLHHHNQPGLAK